LQFAPPDFLDPSFTAYLNIYTFEDKAYSLSSCDHMRFVPALWLLVIFLRASCPAIAADDWSITPAARDGSSTAKSNIFVIPNIIRQQTGYITITNNTCGHFAVVAAGSPAHPCGGITVSSFARDNGCCPSNFLFAFSVLFY
jgi:hypothetical protein